MKQSIWVCTCVATGNNQTNVLIKYLATHWSRLTDVDSGSAVKTYRQLQIEKAHLPVELWESDVFDPENPDA